ncbi:Hypothetical predicted protein [Marmota monax]|nr:Hypothetical predicted protein [Marmota monax]
MPAPETAEAACPPRPLPPKAPSSGSRTQHLHPPTQAGCGVTEARHRPEQAWVPGGEEGRGQPGGPPTRPTGGHCAAVGGEQEASARRAPLAQGARGARAEPRLAAIEGAGPRAPRHSPAAGLAPVPCGGRLAAQGRTRGPPLPPGHAFPAASVLRLRHMVRPRAPGGPALPGHVFPAARLRAGLAQGRDAALQVGRPRLRGRALAQDFPARLCGRFREALCHSPQERVLGGVRALLSYLPCPEARAAANSQNRGTRASGQEARRLPRHPQEATCTPAGLAALASYPGDFFPSPERRREDAAGAALLGSEGGSAGRWAPRDRDLCWDAACFWPSPVAWS